MAGTFVTRSLSASARNEVVRGAIEFKRGGAPVSRALHDARPRTGGASVHAAPRPGSSDLDKGVRWTLPVIAAWRASPAIPHRIGMR